MRTFLLKVTIDWDDCDDIHPVLMIDDMTVDGLKDGVDIEIIEEITDKTKEDDNQKRPIHCPQKAVD